MMLVSLISYIDRNTLALLAPTILKETGLTAEQYGYVISAFSVAYMIGNPLWGRLLDRIGLRGGMTAAVAFWTLASVSHAFAGGFTSFAVARTALGLGEGATFPGGLRAALQTLPANLRSRGVAVAYSGGSLGAIVTPLIVTPIAALYGWRSAFWFTGLVGVLWLMLWAVVSRRPDLRQPRKQIAVPEQPVLPAVQGMRLSFRDPRIWSFMAAYALGGLPLAFVLYGASIYLNRALGATQAEIGAVLWIPPLGWEVGYFFWGWLADRAVLRGQRMRGYLQLMSIATLLGLPLAATPFIPSFPVVMFELFFAMFIAASFVIVTVSYATYVYSSDHAGVIAGLGAGSWSAVVALAMPVFGHLFDERRWDTAFLLAALFPVAGFAIWWAINRTGVRSTSVPAY
jgi:ACS family hexuronate transporter-like MFS transporter